MNIYFNIDDTVFAVTERFPELIPHLVQRGFGPLANPMMRKLMGTKVSLRQAFSARNMDVDELEQELVALIEKNASCATQDTSLRKINLDRVHDESLSGKDIVTIEGVLPCPVRLPLMEHFEAFYTTYCEQHKKIMDEQNYVIRYDLRSASLGTDHIYQRIISGDPEKMPDLIFLTGIDAFLADTEMKTYIRNDVFQRHSDPLHPLFMRKEINLSDPEQIYRLIAAVPAIFVVNHNELHGRAVPKTWADILKPEFAHSVSIPLNDLDMFSVVILGIYSLFGKEGIHNLARSYYKSLHPSQMTKERHVESGTLPAVNVAPYFFTRMVQKNTAVQPIWPEDGAIVSPIFMLAKKKNTEKIQPFIDFFLSKETGDIISAGGYFPSMCPDVDNSHLENKKFLWAGWDLMHRKGLGKLVRECKEEFSQRIHKTGSTT